MTPLPDPFQTLDGFDGKVMFAHAEASGADPRHGFPQSWPSPIVSAGQDDRRPRRLKILHQLVVRKQPIERHHAPFRGDDTDHHATMFRPIAQDAADLRARGQGEALENGRQASGDGVQLAPGPPTPLEADGLSVIVLGEAALPDHFGQAAHGRLIPRLRRADARAVRPS